jgi:hypothetical protein
LDVKTGILLYVEKRTPPSYVSLMGYSDQEVRICLKFVSASGSWEDIKRKYCIQQLGDPHLNWGDEQNTSDGMARVSVRDFQYDTDQVTG